MGKFWQDHSSWKAAEEAWEKGARHAARTHPLRLLSSLPSIPGITAETARHLRWKSLKYIVTHDQSGIIRRLFWKHPWRYGWRLLRSLLRKKSYGREGDFFLYGIPSLAAFRDQLRDKKALFVVGFSYCQKPFECPSGRFTDRCQHDAASPICRQCFIGKAMHALPETAIPLFIPTIHYIGEKMMALRQHHPKHKLLFLITACEMTLEMGGDLGNMIDAIGAGVRLDGRICNTMKAFVLSEQGIKPGLTVLLSSTQQRFLDILRDACGEKDDEDDWQSRAERGEQKDSYAGNTLERGGCNPGNR